MTVSTTNPTTRHKVLRTSTKVQPLKVVGLPLLARRNTNALARGRLSRARSVFFPFASTVYAVVLLAGPDPLVEYKNIYERIG